MLLLGQAESGKSTLQKQFQLLYTPGALDAERLSWRTVIYFNIARPIRRILEALESTPENEDDDDLISEFSPSELYPPSPSPAIVSDEKSLSASASSLDKQVALLRARLSPLLAAETQLADRLSGGVDVSGSGRGSVFVRSGWQSRSLGLPFGRGRDRAASGGRFSFSGNRGSTDNRQDSGLELQARRADTEEDRLVLEVASILNASQADIRELWEMPAVKRLRERRRLKLEEWAD